MNPYSQRVPLVGVGGKACLMGCVVIHVQVEGVSEYDEDQVALLSMIIPLSAGESQLYSVPPPLIA